MNPSQRLNVSTVSNVDSKFSCSRPELSGKRMILGRQVVLRLFTAVQNHVSFIHIATSFHI